MATAATGQLTNHQPTNQPIRIETTAAVVSILCSRSPVGASGSRGGMGNASGRVDGNERYDDGGEPEGPVGMRGPGSEKLFTRGV